MSESTRTYQTRIGIVYNDPLSAYASLMAKVEHTLCAEIAAGKTATSLKSLFQKRFKIIARQYNAARVNVEGKIASIKQRLPELIEDKKSQIASIEITISKLKNKNKLHQKKRRLAKLQAHLKKLEEKKSKISLCFGSKKLFRAQFNLEGNGYQSHEEWKEDWKKARNSEIFILGSKDESSGNQSCTATIAEDGSLTLRLRLPDALHPQFGKYLSIPNVRFTYGHDVIIAALQDCYLRKELELAGNSNYKNHGQAITFRLKKDKKGWIVFASTTMQPSKLITSKENGAVGLDINSDHLAITELDRYGNPIYTFSIPLNLYNKSKNQIRARIGDAAAQVIAHCEKTKKPLILENLDFQKKKRELKEKRASYSRMLSGFAYSSIITNFKSRGQTKGVEVHSVNPAYTSLIGQVKFADRYGMTIHQSAALCIGRRFLGVSERMPQGQRDIPCGNGDHVTLDLPVRNRSRHVWSQWGQLKKKLSVALTKHFRSAQADPRAPPIAAPVIPKVSDFAGEIPAHESLTILLC